MELRTLLAAVAVVAFAAGRNFPVCYGSTRRTVLQPGFQASQMDYIDNDGIFLLSNSSAFGLGFTNANLAATSFLLAVIHLPSSTHVWAANPGSPVSDSDAFVFDRHGAAYLGGSAWSAGTSDRGAAAMRLLDSGNLVILPEDAAAAPLWQSFSSPTDTLLSGQEFSSGMSLSSASSSGGNLTYRMEIDGGDIRLYAEFGAAQPYWSLAGDARRIVNMNGDDVSSARLTSNSWNFYDKSDRLLSQIILDSSGKAGNSTLAAVLGTNGVLSFTALQGAGDGGGVAMLPVKIPQDSCDTPEPCSPYYVCYSESQCRCPRVLSSGGNCNPDIVDPCKSKTGFDLAKVDDGVGYFATGFVSPSLPKTNLSGCQDACLGNCSCMALFYDNSSGNCFLFDQIGSFKQLGSNVADYSSFIKVTKDSSGSGNGNGGMSVAKLIVLVLVICFAAAVVIATLIYIAIRARHGKKLYQPSEAEACSSEDGFLESISGMPTRYSYKELQTATDNFSVKLGQGGFGSVYLGSLSDGTRVAVKKLEWIGQGKKEFRSEVTIIGSIHHIHLVKLRGFCAEGSHRLLAYEYMANGSLDKWLFHPDSEKMDLDWDKRFNIALGTAKGLAYLHQDCDSKIVHCDIKPENVLLDDNFAAKVSDFGLAKLMTREQSHVFTTLRGTRGYLAPEWITNYAISEKSDVYSYGMVLLELIGGRRNYEPKEISEKAHLPSYAFKMMEEGKLKNILDAKLNLTDIDERTKIAIKVALWCIQEDFTLRPSMAKVVQMLEGLSEVPQPPTSSQIGFRMFTGAFKSTSEEGTSSGMSLSDFNSDAFLSAERLSGPR